MQLKWFVSYNKLYREKGGITHLPSLQPPIPIPQKLRDDLKVQMKFNFFKLSCNIYSLCRIRFFTINNFHGINLCLSSDKLTNYFSFRLFFDFTKNIRELSWMSRKVSACDFY